LNILGIDTSCDDTSAAVITDQHRVLSSIVHSQVKLHHPYGGVVPELASREHLRNMVPVVEAALSQAGLGFTDLAGIAVTVGPGLIGSLLVGLYYAKAIAFAQQLPLVGINHLEGHILSIFLEEQRPDFPFLALTVSGGHTALYLVEGYGIYRPLGQTLDDAAGEAYDKVAKILGLGYPGGAAIEKLARQGAPDRISFPRAFLAPDSYDFSFSGLKTAVALYIKRWEQAQNQQVQTADIAASFQEAVVDVLAQKLIKAWEQTGVRAVVIAGGVACNQALRDRLRQEAERYGFAFYYPRPAYCTDNGAMIALDGVYRLGRGERADGTLDVRSRFPIEEVSSIPR
jgi:N6-L-threonylcarbamoyladenine synthase